MTKEDVVKTFLKSDAQLSGRWEAWESNEDILGDIFEQLQPLFDTKINALKDVVDLSAKPLKMRDFKRICKAREIDVIRNESDPIGVGKAGYYLIHSRTSQVIWLKPSLNRKQTLFVAAHELSHFCLHRDLLLKSERLPASKFLRRERFSIKSDQKRGQELLMELEADLFASYLITKR